MITDERKGRKTPSAAQHESNMRNLCGTFAAEGTTVSQATRKNLDRIASGQATSEQVLQELRNKYGNNDKDVL